MNRKNLTAAVLAGLAGAAGIAGTAQAVNVNPDGLGQVLIYPYYTVNGDNATLFSVVNTTEDVKAVKVRFKEAKNSQEVLDFHLYLSAYDVWTGEIANVDDTPTLVSYDTSCTVPDLPNGTGDWAGATAVQEFLPWAMDDIPPTGGTKNIAAYRDISDANEGYFEMIEMGILGDTVRESCPKDDVETICTREDLTQAQVDGLLDPESGPPDQDATDYPGCPIIAGTNVATKPQVAGTCPNPTKRPFKYGLAGAATHVDGVPANCDALVDAWYLDEAGKTTGPWADEAYFDLAGDTCEAETGCLEISDPEGGLFGGAAIVNVNDGTFFSYDAKAFNGFAETQMHEPPDGRATPSLNSGDVMKGYVFDDDGDSIMSADLARSVDALSFTIMHDSVMNEFITGAGIQARTEWVVNFPTKQWYVYDPSTPEYGGDDKPWDNDGVGPKNAAYGTDGYAPVAPFTTEWLITNASKGSGDTFEPDGGDKAEPACEPVSLWGMWDREEDSLEDPDSPAPGGQGPIVSPAPPPDDDDPDPAVPFELCSEVNIIRFGTAGVDETEIFGSENFINFDNETLGFVAGWARIELDTFRTDVNKDGVINSSDAPSDRIGLDTSVTDVKLEGLPVLGFAAHRFGNGFLGDGNDVLANYGGLFDHRGTRKTSDYSPQ